MAFYEDKTPPAGTNSMYLPDRMVMRLYYKENIYPPEGNKPLDLWYARPFYGKVNVDGRAVHLSETNLKEFHQENLFAADFVVDAYGDFISELRLVVRTKSLPEGSFLKTLSPRRAWTSVNNLYHAHFATIHESFVSSYLQVNNKKDEIKGFDDYINLFLKFAHETARDLPISRTSFILSRFCSPLTTGLMVEVGSDKHDQDFFKFDRYINTDEFDCYRNTAAKFGFYVDKNAPWRLVANIGSQQMMKYVKQNTCEIIVSEPWDFENLTPEELENYDFAPAMFNCNIQDVEELFSTYYYTASTYDYRSFKIYMFQSYNTYASVFPFYEKWEHCTAQKTTKVSLHDRELFLDMAEGNEQEKAYDIFLQRYDDFFWLPIYFSLRAKEAQIKMTSHQEHQTLRRILDIARRLGVDKAVDYIDNKTKVSKLYSPSSFGGDFNIDY